MKVEKDKEEELIGNTSLIEGETYGDWCGPLCHQILASIIGTNGKIEEEEFQKSQNDELYNEDYN